MERVKKGFTLIELLAVILILGIIALIAVGTVGNVIDEAKRKSFEVTCNNIYKAIEDYGELEFLRGNGDACVTFDFKNDTNGQIKKLSLQGKLPTNGNATLCNNKIDILVDNDAYTCIKNETMNQVVKGNISENDITKPIINGVALTSTTNSITVIVDAKEPDGTIIKYYYSLNGDDYYESTNATYTFENLESNKEYTVYVKVENKSELQDEMIKVISTVGIDKPQIEVVSQNPVGTEYAQSKVVKITYGGENLQYYFKSNVSVTVASGVVTHACGTDINPSTCTSSSVTTLSANTWYKTTSKTPSITYKANGTLYAITSDNINLSEASTYTINKIDTSMPNVDLTISGVSTNQATVTAVCSDSESGITKYEFSNDDGTTWINNGTANSYIFKDLTKETNYTYKIRCTNGSGMTNTASSKSSTLGMTNPNIEQASETVASGYTWATERVIKITYSGANIESPSYYFKSTVPATVASVVVTGACGTDTNPGTCSTSSVTTLAANTWYRTTNTTPSITYKANGTLYAVTSDGKNLSGTATYVISKTSSGTPTTPTITGGSSSWSNSARTISVSTVSTEASGILKYQYYISTSSSSQTGGSWIDCETSVSISTNGTRYIYFRAIANNGKISSVSGYQTTMIDTANPSVTVSVSGKTATLTLSDGIGIAGYGVNQSTSTQPSWTSASGTSTTKTWTASSAGTYVAWVKDNAGRTATASFTIASTAFCAYTAGQTWPYSYNGGIQSFSVPCAGTYKLEVWGAQGGSNGGYGGYSYGNVSLSAGTVLYVAVGGQGGTTLATDTGGSGGYNGGGAGWGNTSGNVGGGGGATHIGKTNALLSNTASANVYLVAGGGGGGSYNGWDGVNASGGAGGGYSGGGGGTSRVGSAGSGGSQSSGFSYGRGGSGSNACTEYGSYGAGGGGGGGYYGGFGGAGGTSDTSGFAGGGGGSGYIGGVTGGSMSNGVQSGNGKATITLISISN